MSNRRVAVPVSIAIAVGITLWLASSVGTGKREAWDSSAYWAIAYPTAMLACAFLGYFFPDRPWRWAIALFEAQFVAMCLRNGELGGLWPLGMAMFAVISLPGVVAARIAAKFQGMESRT